jgi:hypothetical protein
VETIAGGIGTTAGKPLHLYADIHMMPPLATKNQLYSHQPYELMVRRKYSENGQKVSTKYFIG